MSKEAQVFVKYAGDQLAGLTEPELVAVMRQLIIDTGGVWIDPAAATPGGFGDHVFSVHFMEVSASGLDAAEACRNWLSAARRSGAALTDNPQRESDRD